MAACAELRKHRGRIHKKPVNQHVLFLKLPICQPSNFMTKLGCFRPEQGVRSVISPGRLPRGQKRPNRSALQKSGDLQSSRSREKPRGNEKRWEIWQFSVNPSFPANLPSIVFRLRLSRLVATCALGRRAVVRKYLRIKRLADDRKSQPRQRLHYSHQTE